jgi:hypothetical protein
LALWGAVRLGALYFTSLSECPVLEAILPAVWAVPGIMRPEYETGPFVASFNAWAQEQILTYLLSYGIQLWGAASTSNIEIVERFQSKALRMIVDAPRYVPNTVIRRDLKIPTVKEEIRRYSSQYSACLSAHPNDLVVNLMELPDNTRLRRSLPNDLPTRFLVQLLYL